MIKELRALGLMVRDKADLEAAGVETGIDWEIRDFGISGQTKYRRKGASPWTKEARNAWRDGERIALLRNHEFVLHWREDTGPGRKPTSPIERRMKENETISMRKDLFTWLLSAALFAINNGWDG